MKRFYLLALVASMLAVACAEKRPAVLYGPPQPLSAEDYPQVLEAWTRSAKLYQGLENKMFVTATMHAPEFRRAFPVAFPEIYGQGGNITRRELVELTGDVEAYHNFFLSVYTPVIKWNDLASPQSIWRVTLLGDSEVAVGPKEIVPVKIDENLRAVYPYIGHFDKCYLVRFPMTDAMDRLVLDEHSHSFRLRIASALGVAEMQWALQVVPGASREGARVDVTPPSDLETPVAPTPASEN